MHDVAVNKISLTNPNIDINKWYKGFKEDYADIFNILQENSKNKLFNFILEDQKNVARLVEIKIVLEKIGDKQSIKLIDEVLNLIKYSDDSFIFNDFNDIYKVYKQIFEEIK